MPQSKNISLRSFYLSLFNTSDISSRSSKLFATYSIGRSADKVIDVVTLIYMYIYKIYYTIVKFILYGFI